MKKITWIIMLLSTGAVAQERRDMIQSLPGIQTVDFGEKLVRLAWRNNPESEIATYTIKAADQDIKLANAQWLDIFSLQGNLNEFNIDESRDQFNRSDFYPRYNIGARINLGMFMSVPANVNRTKQQARIARAQAEDLRQALQSQVMQLYHNFMMHDKIYTLHSDLLISAESTHGVNEERFTSGEISFDEYNAAKGAFTEQQIAFYEAEAAYKNAKVQLEELIGMPLEEVN